MPEVFIMDTAFLTSGGAPALTMQGLLLEAKDGETEKDGNVLNVTLVVSETQIKNGSEMTAIESHILKVSDHETFGSYVSFIGKVVSVPVAVWNQNNRYGFFIPRGSLPKLLKLESLPKASVKTPEPKAGVKSPLDK